LKHDAVSKHQRPYILSPHKCTVWLDDRKNIYSII
jgi:hypothetical protein